MGLAFDQELSRSALLRVPVLARSAYNTMSIDLLYMGKNISYYQPTEDVLVPSASGVTLAMGAAAPDWSCTTPLRLALPHLAIAVSIRMSPGKSKNTDKTCAARNGRGRMRFSKAFK